ncbi:MAG: RecQ family ATP-dependent DNA helicase, partial [Bacteroidota bacterium]|nr:RecQ family ATP-dependent DNA helicase [Bacteroidota bacterium]
HPNSPGIIYCLSRKNTENVAAKLQDAGFSAQPYHAGLSKEKRSTTQEDFLNDDIQIIVATIAFGMGIDKSNIRFVMHYNLPKNIEGYYQEIGRAGRDGMPADTMLFYSFGDVMILKQIIANNGQREVQEGKLQRMQEYSDALICRRKILLAYFNEDLKEDCGNCDICKNPPQTFDGTTLTQKALSALLRMKEQVGANMLIDVLRGSSRRDIFEKGYNNIKTYGAGNDTSNYAWQIYLLQIMQQGFIEIAINDNNTLKVTPAGKEILFENRQVKLVKQKEIFEQREANKTKAKTKSRSKATIIKDELFEKLRTKRKEIADQKNVPPYVVFSDATLSQMVENKPIVEQDFLEISGVGDKKLEVYGEIFMQVIRNYLTEKKSSGTNIKGSTYLITWDMLKKEKSIEEIATERKLNTGTVYSHIAYLYTRGFNVNIENYISQSDLNEISAAVKELNYPKELAPIFKHLNEKQDYFKIRLTLAWMEKKN